MALPLELIPAKRPDWEAYSVCRRPDVDPDWWFPADEEKGKKQQEARDHCAVCPVRLHCLERAMSLREEGIWGGTSTAERQKLRKNRSRAHCPACVGQDITRTANEDGFPFETCLACGHSWKADSEPVAQHRGRRAEDHAAQGAPGPEVVLIELGTAA